MNIVLKNANTSRYVAERGWTSRLDEAVGFVTAREAVSHCSREQLTDMECLYTFTDSRHNFTMPIDSMQLD